MPYNHWKEGFFTSNYDSYEKILFDEICKQSETDTSIDWGKNMSILLISDNAPGRTNGLKNYLISKTQISTYLSDDIEDATEIITQNQPDAVVFVAMQKQAKNYDIAQMLKTTYPRIFCCMYAHIDPIVKSTCQRNGIKEFFSDKLPVSEFIKYLQAMIDRTKNK